MPLCVLLFVGIRVSAFTRVLKAPAATRANASAAGAGVPGERPKAEWTCSCGGQAALNAATPGEKHRAVKTHLSRMSSYSRFLLQGKSLFGAGTAGWPVRRCRVPGHLPMLTIAIKI